MTMLHTVNKSPFERKSLDACLAYAKDGAPILLLEDGVYAAATGTAVADTIAGAMAKHTIYVLGPDVKARGIDESQIIEGIKVVDYGGFVDLVAETDNVQAWL